MIEYEPRHWSSHLFDVQGSMVREILWRVTACVGWSIAIVLVDWLLGRYLRGHALAIPSTAHALVGVALGLLLVFRTNTSYDRFWEARKQWGSITNASRNLMRIVSVLFVADRELVRRLGLWTAAFPWTVMQRLHGQPYSLEAPGAELPAEEVARVLGAEHVPLAVARRMTWALAEGRNSGLVADVALVALDQNVQTLIDCLGACERIHNTSMPYAYVVHLRRALIAYCATLPFALLEQYGWATIPTTLVVSYIMFGIEEIGVEIEDPFGNDANSLPLEVMCRTIEGNVRGVLADSARD